MRNKLTFIIIVSLFTHRIHGQGSHFVSVEAPASVAGNYKSWIANFGATYCSTENPIKGELAFVSGPNASTLGCTVDNNLTGKIAVIDRGTCPFSDKALNAQVKGAIAVIIFNNAAGELFPMASSASGADVKIPVLNMTLADGNKLRTLISAGGLNVTIKRFDSPTKSSPGVVWGANPGEGDFRCGINKWTAKTLSCSGAAVPNVNWKWSPNGAMNGSCGGVTYFPSPSNFDGAMVFESDFYDSNSSNSGCGTNAGQGPCPAPQVAELISPEITINNSTAPAFSVEFHQYTRQFRSNYFLLWSTNKGVSWDSVAINTEVTTNADNEKTLLRVPMPKTGGAKSLIIKFRYVANYYYWGIDDVKIVEQEAYNLQVNTFFAVPQNAATPKDFAEPINFLADVENRGAATQFKVPLDVYILDNGFKEIFKARNIYDTLLANRIVENKIFTQTFTPTAKGVYLGYYEISSDKIDADSTDNTREFLFAITDSTFSKDLGPTRTIRPADASWTAGEPHSWAFGNHYYVPKGNNKYIKSISFMMGNAAQLKDQAVVLNIFKWKDANANGNAEPTERSSLGTLFYIIGGKETPDSLVTVKLNTENGLEPIKLEDNTEYLVMLEYYASGTANFEMTVSDDIDYGGMITASIIKQKPRFGALIGIAGDLTKETYSYVGFGGNVFGIVPVVRMNVANLVSTDILELNTLTEQFTVFPNPASDLIHVQFADDQENVLLNFMDLNGKTLSRQSLNFIQGKYPIKMDIPNVAPGFYFIQAISKNGIGVRPLVVK
jgi:hypothetical protein